MDSQVLHVSKVQKCQAFITKICACLYTILIPSIIYYRLSPFLHTKHNASTLPSQPILPWLLVFCSELFLAFVSLFGLAFRWRPVSRIAFPENLPRDEDLPPVDVFIFTADPVKEPAFDVMNTVISAMALDYPPEKLAVYLSDDGGSPSTLYAAREAYRFARLWLPFARKYNIGTRCPKAYFSQPKDFMSEDQDDVFLNERMKVEEKFIDFKKLVSEAQAKVSDAAQSRPTVIEVVNNGYEKEKNVPLLIYVSREKRPSYPHHFKAGAINVLLRVSSMISNAPCLLLLDCDMYCNDPSSVRQAMCFHLDPKLSPSLAFVQFPQKFHNLSQSDIYCSQLRTVFESKWPGMDGLQGPMVSGTCFYMKRQALYGNVQRREIDLDKLKNAFGSSNELIQSTRQDQGRRNTCQNELSSSRLLSEMESLASCTYEQDTKWGKEIGFMYGTVLEDYFTGFLLHCEGLKSVYCNPSRPAFLGTGTTNLNDMLIQNTRWQSGLVDVNLSPFCPIFYGIFRMSLMQSMCYACLALDPFRSLPLWCLATVPQLCLLHDIPIYPKVSSSWFIIYSAIFLASKLKSIHEVLISGGSIQTWWREERHTFLKTIVANLYGTMDGILKKIGLREANFTPTNKVDDVEQVKLYHMGKFNFQTSSMYLIPLVGLVILNMVSLAGGVVRVVIRGGLEKMFGQLALSIYITCLSYPVIEGMVLRKDGGCIPVSIALRSSIFSMVILLLGSLLLVA